MKHLKTISFLFIITFVMMISTVSASEYTSYTAIGGAGMYVYPNGDADNYYIFSNDTSLYITDDTFSFFSLKMINLPNGVSSVCANENYIYLTLSDGQAWKIEHSDGILNWDNLDLNDDYASFGDYDTATDSTTFRSRVTYDSSGNIFVSASDDTITKTDWKFNTQSIYLNSIVFRGTDTPRMCIGSDHFYVLGAYNGYTDRIGVYTVDSVNNPTTLFIKDIGTADDVYSTGIQQLDNGNLVIAYYAADDDSGQDDFFIQEYYINGTLYGSIATETNMATNMDIDRTGSLEVSTNGLVLFFDSRRSTIYTYGTLSGAGGYTFNEGITDPDSQISALTWEYPSYTSGDTATINFNVEGYNYDNYDYNLKIHDTVSLKQTFESVSVNEGSQQYTFSPSAQSSTYLAQLVAVDKSTGIADVLVQNTTSFTASDDTYSIEFDNSAYRIGDTMKIYYSSLPAGSSIYLRGTDSSSTTVYTKTWTSISGTGYISLTVPDNTVETYSAYALNAGYTLDSDYAEVIQSASEITVYGTVYDARTGATIENAHVLINGSGPITNEIGRYSYIIDAGTYPLVCSATGYQTLSYSSVSFLVDTNRNFYLTPTSGTPGTTTASIYGAVRDYETGTALEGAMVTVANSTGYTKTTFSSSTGFYEVTGLKNSSQYSVYASLEGYDNYYNSAVNVSGMTWLEFNMVDEDYNLGDSGTTTTTEYPGRAAAKESLENAAAVVPEMVMMVLFVVFMAVMKKM